MGNLCQPAVSECASFIRECHKIFAAARALLLQLTDGRPYKLKNGDVEYMHAVMLKIGVAVRLGALRANIPALVEHFPSPVELLLDAARTGQKEEKYTAAALGRRYLAFVVDRLPWCPLEEDADVALEVQSSNEALEAIAVFLWKHRNVGSIAITESATI